MPPQKARCADAQKPLGLDEGPAAQRLGLRPGHAAELRDEDQRHDEDQLVDPRAIKGHDGEDHDIDREGADDVEQDHHGTIHQPAEIACKNPKDQARDHGNQHHQKCGDQRCPQANADAGEKVAAKVVGAQPMRRTGASELGGNVDLVGIHGDGGPEDGHGNHQKDHHKPRLAPLFAQDMAHGAAARLALIRGSSVLARRSLEVLARM